MAVVLQEVLEEAGRLRVSRSIAGYVSQLMRLRLNHVRAIENIDQQLAQARATLAKQDGWTDGVSNDTAPHEVVGVEIHLPPPSVLRDLAHVDTVIATDQARRRFFRPRIERAAAAAAVEIDPEAVVSRAAVLAIIRDRGPVSVYQIADALRCTPGKVWPKLYRLEKDHAITRDTSLVREYGPHLFSVNGTHAAGTGKVTTRRSCARCINLFDSADGAVHCARCALVEADERRARLRAFTGGA